MCERERENMRGKSTHTGLGCKKKDPGPSLSRRYPRGSVLLCPLSIVSGREGDSSSSLQSGWVDTMIGYMCPLFS